MPEKFPDIVEVPQEKPQGLLVDHFLNS